MVKHYILSLLLLFSIAAHAQYNIRGTVTDAETTQPLAFANIMFNSNPRLSVATDIDGRFAFNSPEPLQSYVCSYVGYDSHSMTISSPNLPLNISLKASDNALDEVVIKPGENPANRIIRLAIANKAINDPENISSFTYQCYNKIIYDIVPDGKSKYDSVNKAVKEKLKGSGIFMMESVSERKFIAPDISEEVVVATKVSGFKNPNFASLATDLQPFSFYKDNIKLFDIHYLNPISKGSLKKYDFRIEDTIFQNRDTVYIISFKPKPGKNIESLKGTLYINTNKYAVQNVIATPAVKGLIDIRIQQQYTFVDNKYWFPEQLNYTLTLTQYSFVANGKSYLTNVQTDVPLRKKEFSLESVRMHPQAAKKDSLYWQGVRAEELNFSEQRTYTLIDSIGNKNNFDTMLKFLEKAPQGKLPISIFDLDISKTIVYNKYEGLRLGTGLYTNEKLFEKLVLGGFAGYGMKDYEWKYGGEAIYTFSKDKEFKLGIKAQDNLMEAGSYGLNYSVNNLFNARNFFAYNMDHIREASASVGFRMLRYLKWKFEFSNSQIQPMYDYIFTDNGTAFTSYTNTTAKAELRFAFKERLVNSLNNRISMGTPYPVLTLSYARGLQDIGQGDFEYNKVEARVEQSFFSRNFGKTTYRAEAGYIDRPLPYGLMFTGEGSYDKDYPVIVKNYFQTMLPYEFLSDRYANLFLTHNFGSLLFQSGNFNPIVSIHNNFGWGELDKPENHGLIAFKTKNKIFAETGIQLDNVVKWNYMNVGFLGFGAGLYYRYGEYAHERSSDNITLKMTFSFSIR